MRNKLQSILFENHSYICSLQNILELSSKISLPIKLELNIGENKWNDILPFKYGEFSNHINPSDNMGWDVIILSEDLNNVKIKGIVPIHPEANKIPHPNGNKPGNHKLILSNQELTDDEKHLIDKFFENKKQFLKPIFFNEISIDKFLKEDWESKTLTKYKLGHFKDKDTIGIAVGPVSRKYYGAKKVNEPKPTTN